MENLGYLVDKEGLHAAPAKVEAITKAPEPRNAHELRTFLGLVNYFAKFIHYLSTITQPFNHLLCQSALWKWMKECQQAFLNIASIFKSSSSLQPKVPNEAGL